MDRIKVISVVVILSVLSLTVYKLNLNKVNNKEVDKVRVIDTKENNNMFAFMIQGDDGNYTQSSSNTWPGEGYKLNTERTQCMDNNGVEVKNGITYNASSKIVTVTSSNTSYCYLYFDIKPNTGGNQILDKLPASSGLSASKLGDMRRYQGSSAKNYICINATGNQCNSGSDEMYRIIGIVEDGDEAGQIKVIKETQYGNTYAWNAKYQASQCSGTTCSWPNSDLSKTLNTTFLQSLPTKVQNVIVAKQWYYGDLGLDYANKDAATIYQIETGAINTQYYDVATGNRISNQTWQKTSESKKIGLMYLHDYYWQSTITNCHYNSSTHSQCKSNGWMHFMQNVNISDQEWTMSRIGRDSSSYTYAYAWLVYSDGGVNYNTLGHTYVVRPVFYLSSDVKIKDGGTGEKINPYILDLN